MYLIRYIYLMTFGFHLLAWRRERGLSQVALAERTGIARPYLSRLERDDVDPSLSLIRRLAAALDLKTGALLDSLPHQKFLTKNQMDRLARETLRLDRQVGRGDHSLRRLRVRLGEDQWKALLRRVEKHASL
jgi:transcriptional regulator with XRE-family HTH domain